MAKPKEKSKDHSFKKHPSKHKDKKVRDAFRMGVKTGQNQEKKK